MWELIGVVASAFGLVFLAELGDKTQLLALGFGARYPFRTVLLGLILGFGAAGAIAVVVGGVLGAALPSRAIAIGGGVVFLLFALNALRGARTRTDDSPDAKEHVINVRSAIGTIALTIAIGELGDKTQLTTATLAAQANPLAVWVGATMGEVTAASIGAFAGLRLGARLNPRTVQIASAALFAVFGVLLLATA